MSAETDATADERRKNSRLEVDDPQHCKECGAEIEIDTDGEDGMRYDFLQDDYVAVERCAACFAEIALKKVSLMYGTDVAFDATVRGLQIETEVKR